MSAYTAFLNDVMPDVPGCTVELATHAIKNSCIEFCEKTLILQRDHDPVTVVAGIVDYDFEPPAGQLVTRIMRAWYKTTELTPLAPDDVNRPEVYNRLFTGANVDRLDPGYILQKDERTFSLYPIPVSTVANALTMRVAYKPSRSSTTVEDVIYEDYSEAIAKGAKARLMMSPGKPYTNPQLAAAELELFRQAMNVARQRASRGHVRSDLSVTLRSI
jgi:hypothetical protein